MIARLIITFFTLIILISCRNNNEKIKTSFDVIDVSLNRGRDGIISFYVDSTKNIKIKIIDYEGHKLFYQDTLNDSTIVLLNQLSDKIVSAKPDSTMGAPSCFTYLYYFDILSKKQHIQTLVHQDMESSNPKFGELIETILLLTRTIEHAYLDSNFTFKSLAKVMGPPRINTDSVKFIPPIIKYE